MEITVKELKHTDLITIQGRVDSVQASRLAEALEAANQHGIYIIVVDMSQVEYMSSAGFRALGAAQRNSKRHPPAEVIFTQVPDLIREALEIVGFTDYFKVIDPLSAALQYAENLSAGVSGADMPPLLPEK
jgi:anti-sigma B factor antagonist